MSLALPVDLQTLLDGAHALIRDPGFWWEVGVLLLAAAGALLVHRTIGQGLAARTEGGDEYTVRYLALKALQRILFPISMLLGVLAGRALLQHPGQPGDAARPGRAPAGFAGHDPHPHLFPAQDLPPRPGGEGVGKSDRHLDLDRRRAASAGLAARRTERPGRHGHAGGQHPDSVLATLKLVLALALLWLLAQWLGRVIENRISRAEYVNAGMQVALVKLSKFVLLVLVFLLALDAVGIDLTALTVFGGALGVGLGFGLQRIASNFISGFIVLFDRSIRPGDVITIDNKLGWVQELRARYVVVKDRDGVERLIPNENLITNEVINWSYSDRNVRLKIPVSISYDNDPEQALALLAEAAKANPRVLADPAPTTRLMAFGDSGIELELRVWIQDPEAGMGSVRSDINLAIWRAFKDAGIVIPYPQRDLHIRSGLEALQT
jgi:small-conductance mechanosensitive channel